MYSVQKPMPPETETQFIFSAWNPGVIRMLEKNPSQTSAVPVEIKIFL